MKVKIDESCPLCLEEGDNVDPYIVRSERGWRIHARSAHPDFDGEVDFVEELPFTDLHLEPDDEADRIEAEEEEPAGARVIYGGGEIWRQAEKDIMGAEALEELAPYEEELAPYDETLPEKMEPEPGNPEAMVLVPSKPNKQSWIPVLLKNNICGVTWVAGRHRLRSKWVNKAGTKIGPQCNMPLRWDIAPGEGWVLDVMVPAEPLRFSGTKYLQVLVFEVGGREFTESAVVIRSL